MKKYTHLFTVLLWSLFYVGCTTVTHDIHVEARSDPMVDLSNYKTYAWQGLAAIENEPLAMWKPLQLDIEQELKWLINRELRDIGMTEVTVDPDMYVTFTIGIDMSDWELQKMPTENLEPRDSVPQGELYVILVDAVTGYLAWVGKAQANIKYQPIVEEVRQRLNFSVIKMFELYPVVN